MPAPAVSVQNLYQSHVASWVLKDISFEVKPGEIAVLTGVNGVGKTTLLTTIAGMISPAKGTVSVFGNRRRCDADEELSARKDCAYLPDDEWLPAGVTLETFLAAAGSLFGVPESELPDRIDSLLKLFALDGSRRHDVSSLSAGQKKKAGLVSVLLSDRRLLMLDEPFSGGLDPAGILAVRRLLKHRAEVNGQTILMTTPVTELVTELADRLLVLRDGELAFDLTREQIMNSVPEGSNAATWIEGLVFPDVHEQVDRFVNLVSAV